MQQYYSLELFLEMDRLSAPVALWLNKKMEKMNPSINLGSISMKKRSKPHTRE
jgi:hypothetical protein